jgi:hypothetical protein
MFKVCASEKDPACDWDQFLPGSQRSPCSHIRILVLGPRAEISIIGDQGKIKR